MKLAEQYPSTVYHVSGLVFTIVDLFEMKCTTTLHCSIHGSMDCSNLRFIGARTHSSYKPTKRPVHTSTTASGLATASDEEPHDAVIVVLDYFPDPVTSYFFTIRLWVDMKREKAAKKESCKS